MLDDDDNRPFPHVPTVNPDDWRRFSVFRETFLCEAYNGEHVEAYRAFGKLQDYLVGEGGGFWPFRYIDVTAHILQAVLADLRVLQGFLVDNTQRTEDDREGDRIQFLGDEEAVKRHDALCDLGKRLSQQLGALADELEEVVGSWRFKDRPSAM